jgi:hypothetical protein
MPFLSLLDIKIISKRAHASTLAVLGYQHKEQDLLYLLKVAQDDKKVGQYGLIRLGALRGTRVLEAVLWYCSIH